MMTMLIVDNRTTAALDWIYTNAMPFETCSRVDPSGQPDRFFPVFLFDAFPNCYFRCSHNNYNHYNHNNYYNQNNKLR